MADLAKYTAKIISVTKVDNRIDVGVEFYKNKEKFPGPVISVDASSATKEEVENLIKAELEKFKAGYAAEAELQKLVGQEVSL